MGTKIKEDTNKILSNFLRSFGNNELSSCVSCTGDLVSRVTSGINTTSILKEICIKSIVPVHLRQEVDYTSSEGTQDLRFPFCQECSGLVSTLTDLYRQLTAIQEEYDKVRGAIMRGIVNTYGSLKQQEDSNFERDEDESEIFNCWKCAMGIETDLSNVTNEILPMNNIAVVSVATFNPEVVQLIDIKTEIKEEEEDFLDIPEFLVPVPEELTSSLQLQRENNTIDPVVRLHRLVERKFEPSESFNADNDNYANHTNAGDEIDSKSQPSDDESNKTSDNEDAQSVEDEYVPPYEIDDIPNIKRLTRNRAQSESIRIYNLNSLRSTDSDSEGSSQSEYKNGNSSNSMDSEKDEIGVFVEKVKKTKVRRRRRVKDETEVTRPKRPYTRRIPGTAPPKRKRKPVTRIPCPICQKIICSSSNLTLHMRIHTGEKPHKCTYCEKSFYKPSNLRAHLCTHTKNKTYVCDICGAPFAESASMRCHKAAIHAVFVTKVIFECEMCLKEFLTQGRLTAHLATIHKPNRKRKIPFSGIWCCFCEKEFEDIETLKEHKNTQEHLAVKASIVELKKKEPYVPKPEKTENEPKVKKGPKEKKEPKTKNRSTSKREPGKKVGGRRKITERPCAECDLIFPDLRLLKIHQTRFHPKRDFQCEFCGKSFTSGSNLKKHLPVHQDQKPYVCQFCGEGFAYKLSLTHHLTKHTGEGQFKCENCPRVFNDARKFRRHLALMHAEVHLKEKSFICNCCYLNFESQQILSEHLHNSHEHLKCEFCGKYFPVRPKLMKHLLIHTGEKPHKCSICQKTFTQRENLREHENRHTGNTPYKCTYCNAGFYRRKEMEKHMDKNHQNDRLKDQNNSSQQNVKVSQASYSTNEISPNVTFTSL